MNTVCEQAEFEFLDFSILRGNGLDLVLCDVVNAECESGRAPMYCFEIRLAGHSGHIGDLSLCVGDGGQVGLATAARLVWKGSFPMKLTRNIRAIITPARPAGWRRNWLGRTACARCGLWSVRKI